MFKKIFIGLTLVFVVLSSINISIADKTLIEDNFFDNIAVSFDSCIEGDFKILYPLSSVPALVEKTGNFTVRLDIVDFDDVFAVISTAYEPVVDEIWLDVDNIVIEDDSCSFDVFISADVPEELYNLTVIMEDDATFYYTSRPRAVGVFDSFSDNFSFVHVTDLHMGDPRGFAESIKETIGFKSIKKCIEEINLMNPDFIVITGDLVFGQLYPFEYSREYKKCFDLIQMFDAPTFLCPGNHDGYRRIGEDGLELWKEYFGLLNYSFDYGNYHFTSVNSFDWPKILRWCISIFPLNWGGYIGDSQLSWIENDLQKNNDSKLKFMLMHHKPLDIKKESLIGMTFKNREEVLLLIDDYDVDMVLAGHNHMDTVNYINNTIFITTTTPESQITAKDGYWGYRLITIENSSIKSYNYKEPKFSIPTYKIFVEYDGLYSANVENNLDKDIEILLKFTVPKKSYYVENGTVVQIREDHLQRQYYILTQVEKNSEKNVKLTFIS